LGIGEPKHATPEFIKKALAASLDTALSGYPGTAGEPAMRQACAAWLAKRYQVQVDPATQILPVNGSREALFSLAQTVLDPTKPGGLVVTPNPFYQIYEGAAILGGAQPYFVGSQAAQDFAVDWDSVPSEIWAKTQLLFVCSPGNPTGKVVSLVEWKKLFD
jgi:N-succinyldiaminopimelate aminotransferase